GWFDPFVSDAEAPELESEGKRFRTLPELIEAHRVIVLAASTGLSPAPIMGPSEIAQLTGRYFVNTARGELVDEPALLAASREGRLAGVALDVITDENGANLLPRWLELAANQNVIITPHIAGATFRSMQATEEFMVEKLAAALTEFSGVSR